jgi:hypothetical protein
MGDGRLAQEFGYRDVALKFILHTHYDARCRNRIAAEVKEVVVDAYLVEL